MKESKVENTKELIKELRITPYNKVENGNFLKTKLIVNKEDFIGVPFQEGKTTFFIENCYFQDIEITSSTDFNYDISIVFYGCEIGNLVIEKYEHRKTSLIFLNTILSGLIKNNQVKQVNFNNTIINGSIFCINIDSVSVKFDLQNTFDWKRLFAEHLKRRNENLDDFLAQKQDYNFEGASSIYISQDTKRQTREKNQLNNQEEKEEETKEKNLLKNQKIAINLKFNHRTDKVTLLTNIDLYSLSLKGKPRGRVNIENAKIERFYIHEFFPQEEFTIYDLNPITSTSSQLEIHKSVLDNTWFDNVNFNEYKLVSFFRTRFFNTVFSSCTFPFSTINFNNFQALENVHYPEQKREGYYKDQYETFLQLRNALNKTGNVHETQKLQAIAYNSLEKVKDVSKWDKYILGLNRLTNNHNISIKRPLFLLLIISPLLYLLYLANLGYLTFGAEVDYRIAGNYFAFLDITHRSNFLVPKEELNFGALLIDFLNKILVGYFIYQFIAAFRRYGKR